MKRVENRAGRIMFEHGTMPHLFSKSLTRNRLLDEYYLALESGVGFTVQYNETDDNYIKREARDGVRHFMEGAATTVTNEENMWYIRGRHKNTRFISPEDMSILFPQNDSTTRRLYRGYKHTIIESAAILGYTIAPELVVFKPPEKERSPRFVVEAVQKVIREKNNLAKAIERFTDKKSDPILAWVLGGYMPFTAALLNSDFPYPALSLKRISDTLESLADKSKTEMLSESDKKTIEAFIYALSVNDLPTYKSDIDIVISKPVEEAKPIVDAIVKELKRKELKVETIYRDGQITKHKDYKVYEVYIVEPDGKKQKYEFLLGHNHFARSDFMFSNASLGTSIATEMFNYYMMRLVMDGENMYFFDPPHMVQKKGQEIGINPFMKYLEPAYLPLLPFYALSCAAYSNISLLSEWDRREVYDIGKGYDGILWEAQAYGSYDRRYSHLNSLPLIALHAAQKVFKAHNAESITQTKELFNRIMKMWEASHLYQLVNTIARFNGYEGKRNYTEIMIENMVQAHQQKRTQNINTNVPNEESGNKTSEEKILIANKLPKKQAFNAIKEPEKALDNIQHFIESY